MNPLEQAQRHRDQIKSQFPVEGLYKTRPLYRVFNDGSLDEILPTPGVHEEYIPSEEGVYEQSRILGRVIVYRVKGVSKINYQRGDLEGWDYAFIDSEGEKITLEFKQFDVENSYWNFSLVQKQSKQTYQNY